MLCTISLDPGSESETCCLDIGFRHMNFAFPNSALDALYLRFNLKDQVKNLRLELFSWIRVQKAMHALWT